MPTSTSSSAGCPNNAASSLFLVPVVSLSVDRRSFVNHGRPQKSLIIKIKSPGTAIKSVQNFAT
jgi:hypothetical protein